MAAAGAAGGLIAATALRHAEDNLAELCCRHCNAWMPPGVTLEQFAMKSERQLLRIAFFCASVGCCAVATPADKQSATTASTALNGCLQSFPTGTSQLTESANHTNGAASELVCCGA